MYAAFFFVTIIASYEAVMKIEYIKDNQVDKGLDQKIRKLLSTCFIDEDESIFAHQRYYQEIPTHRYLLTNREDELIAHVAVHDKQVYIENNPIPIAGIAEVCVHPMYRKNGYVRKLLAQVHIDIESRDISYSILFGSGLVYKSSGYNEVTNLLIKDKNLLNSQWQAESAMVREITRPWPISIPVKLEGIAF